LGRRVFAVLASLLAAGACTHITRTIILEPNPDVRRAPPPSVEANRGPSTAATLGVPPGHLPKASECRIWIPGTPPGRQPKPKSRPCAGIAALAPAGSWIIYRPTEDRKVVHVREVDSRRAGAVIRIRIFDIETTRLLREENP
jgi:hypothetical protein